MLELDIYSRSSVSVRGRLWLRIFLRWFLCSSEKLVKEFRDDIKEVRKTLYTHIAKEGKIWKS